MSWLGFLHYAGNSPGGLVLLEGRASVDSEDGDWQVSSGGAYSINAVESDYTLESGKVLSIEAGDYDFTVEAN